MHIVNLKFKIIYSNASSRGGRVMHHFYKNILILSLISGLISCTEITEQTFIDTTVVEVIEPTNPEEIINADIKLKEDIPFSIDLSNLFELSADGHVFTVIEGPIWAYIDGANLKGIATNRPFDGIETIKLRAQSKNGGNSIEKSFYLGIDGDPLRGQQWHLKNYKQNTFSSNGGNFGFDANVIPVYADFILGNGVKIAVSDSGVETTHNDLNANMLDGEHRNYTLHDHHNQVPTTSDSHGTAVSGIIAGVGWNNIGITGVAPKAKIAGFQFIESSQSTSIMIDQASGDFDIFNYSYGDVNYFDVISNQDYLDHLRYMVINGRGGKGAFFVKSAGNEFLQSKRVGEELLCASHNANSPLENESPYMLIVGAVNAHGYKSSYSNAGSNLWVSAPGGEFGSSEPAILTTDLSTCFKGYSSSSGGVNSFEYGHELNPNCEYTSTMNGTSSSAPIVSGVIALILEANPNLSWRDVKHILAMSSKKINPESDIYPMGTNHPSTSYSNCRNLSLTGYQYEQGWVTNAAGNSFNNYYGFGLVDAHKAVKMAKDFSLDPMGWLPLPDFVETDRNFGKVRMPFKFIPNNNKNGITDSVAINYTLKVESIQIKVSIAHPKSGELGIELTSPSGTKSILQNINNSYLLSGDSNLNIVLSSHAFYGENSQGNWTLRVIDGGNLDNNTGNIVGWSINILGHY